MVLHNLCEMGGHALLRRLPAPTPHLADGMHHCVALRQLVSPAIAKLRGMAPAAGIAAVPT